MDDTIYTLSRAGLLQMRDTLRALQNGAEEAENWARNFSQALVHLTPSLASARALMQSP
jgi:hypothetical protein